MTKVSVIVPVYNVEAYLRQCLDSLVGQSLREIEVVCVDDGSTDGSSAILSEYAAKDGRVKVLSHKHTNAGAARNAGMAVATGEYLGFADSDDWCEPTLFEKAYSRAKADDADVVLWKHCERDDATGKVIRNIVPSLPSDIRFPCDGAAFREKAFSCFNFAPWNRLVKADFVRRNKIEFQPLDRSNDVVFGCLAIAAATRISYVGESLYNYRARATGNLQSANQATPLSIVQAWSALSAELRGRNLAERFRAGLALTSMYSITRTLDVLSAHEKEYAELFGAVKSLFEKDEFFSTVKPEDVRNDIMAESLRLIKSSPSYSAFAMRNGSNLGKWMMKFFRDRESSRLELAKLKAAAAKHTEARRLPDVALVVTGDNGDGMGRDAFLKHVATLSMSKRAEAIFADRVSSSVLDGISRDYVAILDVNDRYINEHALERMVNTAKAEGADIVGGVPDPASSNAADFVFKTDWLRRNAYLLSTLASDEQAFVATALVHAGKIKVLPRPFTEHTHHASTPLVSVVVPAYNTEKLLDRCLESLVRQTYKRLEIIVVDDGSTDSTPALCDKWAGTDERIRVIHKKNGGLSSARNAGMDAAKGKFIGFVDADDYVERDMFGEMADALEDNPTCDLAKCGVAVEYTYKVSEDERKATLAYFDNPVEGCIRPDCDIVNRTDVCAWDKLYRADFLRANGIRFPEGAKNEDEAFFFEVFCRARNCFFTAHRHYHYLRNDEGIMAKQQKAAGKGEIPDATKIYAFVAELLQRENRRDLLGVLYRHMAGFVQRFIGTPIEEAISDCTSAILHKTKAFHYADLVCGESRQWVQERVFELLNRAGGLSREPEATPEEWFPKALPQEVRTDAPLVSFIVPVYNVEKYVAATLESLRRQSVPDFEVICVDDGSIDDSARILDFYAKIDRRIKVWHLENGGVSRARNFGMEKASGRYIAFVDGDDRLRPHMAAQTLTMAAMDRLDAVMFDYRCVDCDSMMPVEHYWQLSNHVKEFPQNKAFSVAGLESLPVYGACWAFLWSAEFLRRTGARFPDLKLGEDLVWVLAQLSKVRRMRVLNAPFYDYRRGDPSSAVSRLQTAASDAPTQALKGLAEVLDGIQDEVMRKAFLSRMAHDVLFYGERMPKARAWLSEKGFDAFGGIELLKSVVPEMAARFDALAAKGGFEQPIDIEYFIRMAPRKVQKIMRDAIIARNGTKKDLVIVAGQLNSTTNEPIDSWTFFRWLQTHGVPCRYVVWKKHCMVDRMREDNGLKDVILLSGNGFDDFEFITKCRDLLPRLRAVVMENTALNPLTWRYFHMLDGCSYIFMQHGPTFWKMAPTLASSFAVANYVNATSETEKRFLEEHVPEHWETKRKPRYLIAGLPRWDLLKDESAEEGEKVVFFMPTWRAAFNKGMEAIEKSAYLSGIRSLVCEENIERLKKRNVRIIMAAHHHLVNHVKGLDFSLPIKLVPTSEISYWIRHASLCVTDYSSVSFDFLFLDKPCIFWIPDRHDGLLKGDDYAEVVFAEHQGQNMFNRVGSVEEVVSMIEKYADAGFRLEPEKCAIAGRHFAYRHDICARLYEQICAIDGREARQ